jgi:penicillin amidase/acyl-homoserine-lactone acylase
MPSVRHLIVSAAASALLLGGMAGCATAPAGAGPGAEAPARAYDARIRRDTWGVPHVYGRTDADAAYGLAYAHAEDDWATFQESILTSRGQLASLKGPGEVNNDWMFHLMDAKALTEARYEQDLPPEVRRVIEGYAEGLNRYAAVHPDKVLPGLLPITGKDIVAGTVFRGPTFYGLDDAFNAVINGRLKDAPPASATPAGERGSNAVSIAPHRSADGATRLLYNSHQPFTGPYAWYEAVVESGEGWHVAGGFFPGAPFLLGGHNRNLGWGATVNRPDLVDTYRLTINPANPDQYRLDGQWRDFDKRFVDIAVKQKDGSTQTVRKEILRSAHGPAIRTDKGVYAVRWVTSGGARQLHQNYRMNKARNLAEFQAAMAMQALPSINYLYADDRGNIGFVHNGLYAERPDVPGVDWKGVIPGDRSDLIWTRTRPFSQTPQIWNPRSGFLFNANNDPFYASVAADDLKRSDYPASMGFQTDMTNRAWRAIETYGADSTITPAEWDAYKYDDAYSRRSDTEGFVTKILAMDAARDPDLAEIQRVLRTWDRRTNKENRAAALPALTWLFMRLPGNEDPAKAMKAAAAHLKKNFGRIDPTWGEVNRHRRGAVDLPLDGGPDIFRAIYGQPDKDGRLRAFIGDSYVMFVEWDRQGRLSSRSIHQYGAATLDAASPHYADQAPLFAEERTKPVWFTEAQLRGNIAREYRP